MLIVSDARARPALGDDRRSWSKVLSASMGADDGRDDDETAMIQRQG